MSGTVGFVEGNYLSKPLGAALEPNRLVKLVDGEFQYNTASTEDEPVGVIYDRRDVGETIAAHMLDGGGTRRMTAAGPAVAGAKAFAAADGKVQTLPSDPGFYLRIGTFLTDSTQDGDLVEVLPARAAETAVICGEEE